MTDHTDLYSNETLERMAADRFPWNGQPSGTAKAASYLLEVDDLQARQDIDGEARIRVNVCGGIYSYAVRAEVNRYLSGDHSFPYVEANRRMLEREREQRERTGVFRPESINRAFSGLPHR